MHTEGKLGYLRSKKKHTESLFLTTDAYKSKDMFVGKVYGFGIHDEKANAARMVLCWNLHDELLAACKGMAEILLAIEASRGLTGAERDRFIVAEKAIERAE